MANEDEQGQEQCPCGEEGCTQFQALWASSSSKMACDVFIHVSATLFRSASDSRVGAFPAVVIAYLCICVAVFFNSS